MNIRYRDQQPSLQWSLTRQISDAHFTRQNCLNITQVVNLGKQTLFFDWKLFSSRCYQWCYVIMMVFVCIVYILYRCDINSLMYCCWDEYNGLCVCVPLLSMRVSGIFQVKSVTSEDKYICSHRFTKAYVWTMLSSVTRWNVGTSSPSWLRLPTAQI